MKNSAPIRVMLVDDHQIVLWGLERLIAGEAPRMRLVATAASAHDAHERVVDAAPDVILFGLDMDPGFSKAIPELVSRSKARVLALTAAIDDGTHDAAILAGASGVITKHEPVVTILRAIEKAYAGELWLDRAATARLFMELSRSKTTPADRRMGLRIATLTRREREIVGEMSLDAGVSIRAVAGRLGISERTLRNHLSAIYEKLGVSSRLELWDYAQKNNMARNPNRAPVATPS